MDKRIINYRPLLFAFVGLILGIIISRLFLLTNVSIWILITALIVLVTAIIIVFVYTYRLKNLDANNRYRKNVYILLRLSIIMFFIMMIIGTFISLIPYRNILDLHSLYDVEITGTIFRDLHSDSSKTSFILSDCSIKSGDSTIKLKYSVYVTTSVSNLEYGDVITFTSDINAYNYLDKTNFSMIAGGVGYSTYVYITDIDIIASSPTIRDKVKNNVESILDESMDENNSNIAMAMLFGDKSNLDESTRSNFAHIGISHILAVSGLHISIIISALYFIMKKMKINRWVGLCIFFIILLAYSYICGFTVSVVRATIMGLVLYLSSNFDFEYDSISSMSIAGIIILLFSPMALYTMSFQLSFLCILSIVTIAPAIIKLLDKIKCPKIISQVLAMSISTNLVLLPIMMENFQNVSLLGIFFNIIVIPIFTIAFTILVIAVLISVIFGFMKFLLIIPSMLLHIIRWIAGIGSNVNALVFHSFRVGYWVLAFVILLCLSIHYLMLKKKLKLTINIIIASFLLPIVIYSFVPANYSREQIVLYYQTSSNVVYYMKDNNITLIGSNIDSDHLSKMSRELRINKIDSIIAYDFSIKDLQNLSEICQNMNVDRVYIPSQFNYPEINNMIDDIEFYSETIALNSIVLHNINHIDDIVGCVINTSKYGDMVITRHKLSQTHLLYVYNEYSHSDYLISNRLSNNVSIDVMEPKNIITHSEQDNAISLYKIRKYTFYIGV